MDDPILLLLRLVHIGAGVFWVGAAFAFFLFVQPSAKALGPEGEGAFMADLTQVRRFPMVILTATVLTVGAGLILYLRNAGGIELWLGSATGVGFTIGSAAALVSFALGAMVVRPAVTKLTEIGRTLREARRPPTPEEAAAIGALKGRLGTFGKINLVFLAVAVLFMATSRYLG